jgi:hypothetical protein
MRIKVFEVGYQETLIKFEDQVNALIKECEKQWIVLDADIVVDSNSMIGKSFLVVKYEEKQT